MKKRIAFLMLILLVACAPTPEQIANAIHQTQTAAPTQTPTITTTPTIIYTPTMASTSTPTTQILTYILEDGFCIMDVGKISGNPTGHPGCVVSERKQVQIVQGHGIQVSQSTFDSTIQIYCSLYDMGENWLMSDIDTTGSGVAACAP
jgi:hypothetical protein